MERTAFITNSYLNIVMNKLSMTLSMNVDFKRAINTNYSKIWNSLSVDNAVRIINELINHINNAAVYRKEMDHMKQIKDEHI